MARSLDEAIHVLKGKYGRIEVTWGEAHRLVRGDRQAPASGAPRSLPALWMADGEMEDGRIKCTFGSSFTMLVQFRSDGHVEAYSLLPYGESEDPGSPHHADQMPLKSRGELKRAWFYLDDIERNMETRKEVAT